MIDIVKPLSLVHGAIGIDEGTQAISFSLLPLALVDIAIGMSHPAFTLE